MKIKLSKNQWKFIGKKAGWMKKAGFDILREFWENSNIQIPDDIKKHISAASQDLYFGPLPSDYFEEGYSFTKSISIISEWWNNLDLAQYCDEDGYPLSFSDIENQTNPEFEDVNYHQIDKSSLKPYIFGKELSSYIK